MTIWSQVHGVKPPEGLQAQVLVWQACSSDQEKRGWHVPTINRQMQNGAGIFKQNDKSIAEEYVHVFPLMPLQDEAETVLCNVVFLRVTWQTLPQKMYSYERKPKTFLLTISSHLWALLNMSIKRWFTPFWTIIIDLYSSLINYHKPTCQPAYQPIVDHQQPSWSMNNENQPLINQLSIN